MATRDHKVLEKFVQLIYRKSGISLSPDKQKLAATRVKKRVKALGLDSLEAYYRHLYSDTSGRELVELLNAVSTDAPAFFRAPRHFEILEDFVRRWHAEGQRNFHIWSAACSSGEEVYSIALSLQDYLNSSCNIRILGTDISRVVLEKAAEGKYTREQLEEIPRATRQKYFVQRDDGADYRVGEELQRLVTFEHLNLADTPYPLDGPFDAVFCRNVMFYFDEDVRRNLLHELQRLLKPGGLLFVGESENLATINKFFVTLVPSVYTKQIREPVR